LGSFPDNERLEPDVLRLACRRVAVSVLAVIIALTVFAPAALADHRECGVISGVYVCWVVKDPRPPTGPNSPGGGEASVVCSWRGQALPCHEDAFGWFDNTDGCYYALLTPQPAYDSKLWEGHPAGQGAIYHFMCLDMAGTGGGWKWRATSAQPATVTAVQLAQKALATLRLPKPVPPSTPWGARLRDGRPFTVVRVPTWFWTAPASYQVKSARASAGPVWAEVTVTPVALTFTPGDGGKTVSCAGPGRVWTPAAGQWAHAPGGCDHAYELSTYGYPGGQLTATYGIVWRATWVGSGGAGGSFPDVTTTATSRFAVAEAQAVIVK
jgi:hypothetical protein